ncbi:MAG TPA: hypothetical protein VIV40_06470 [Kofleriaceae bacterium]
MKIWALGLIAVLSFAVGCKAKDTPPAKGSAAPFGSGTASPAQIDAGAGVTTQRSPLQQALREIRDDGTWSKDTALRAFAAAFGDLPGVKAPGGPRPAMEHTDIALRMLLRYWSAITPAQRAAANAIFGAELAKLTSIYAPKDTVFAGPGIDSEDKIPGPKDNPKFLDTASAEDVAAYQAVLDEVVPAMSQLAQRKLPFRVTVRLRDLQPGPTSTAEMLFDYVDDAVTGCVVHVYKLGRTFPAASIEARSMLAHEAWHCFQAIKNGLKQHLAKPPWLVEGQAMWVGEAFVRGTTMPTTVAHWKDYLLEEIDQRQLFARNYDAIGFYAHLADEGVNVWHVLDNMMAASTNARAFEIGVDRASVLSSWGSSFFLDPKPTKQFTMINSWGRPTNVVVPRKRFALGDGDTGQVIARAAATNDLADVEVSTDVLTVVVEGHGILGDLDGPVHELNDDTRSFCVKAPCKCPDGLEAVGKLPALGVKSRIAVSGNATAGSRASVTAYSMAEFCKGPVLPQLTVWQGTWASTKYRIHGTFELAATMTSSKITGNVKIFDSDCVSDGKVTGTITNGTVKFGTVASGPGVVWNGTIAGNKMEGTFTAHGCGEDVGTWSAQH